MARATYRVRQLPMAELRAVKAQLRAHLANGLNEDAIAAEPFYINDRPGYIDLRDLRWLKNQLIRDHVQEVQGKRPSEIYGLHCIRMEGIIDDLNKVRDAALGSKQPAAAVGAVKAKKDILDSMIERGQELGVIPKRAKQVEVIGSQHVAEMSDDQLRDTITSEVMAVISLMNTAGERDFMNIEPEPMYVTPRPQRRKVLQ